MSPKELKAQVADLHSGVAKCKANLAKHYRDLLRFDQTVRDIRQDLGRRTAPGRNAKPRRSN